MIARNSELRNLYKAKFLGVVIVVLFSLLLSACGFSSGSHGEQVLDNYQARLENVFADISDAGEIQTQDFNTLSVPTLPQKPLVQVWQTRSSESIDILDFMSLYGCRLQETVAQANSSLGRVATASQRVLYLVRFLRDAPSCIAMLETEEKTELARIVKQEMEYKRQQFPYVFTAMLIEGEEFSSFWRLPKNLGSYPENTNPEPILALSSVVSLFKQWQSENYVQTEQELETMLFQINIGDGGALLSSFSLLNNRLEVLNSFLEGVLDSEQICVAGRHSSKIMQNVVQKYFVGEVQQWAADLNRRQYALSEAMADLEGELAPMLSESYARWRKERTAVFQRNKALIQRHVLLIGKLINEEKLAVHCDR